MLLLDNFVHSDLHPGNIMVKFYKPSTDFIIKGMVADILGTRKPVMDPSHPSSSEDAKVMDAIVDHLRNLSSDRSAWQEALQSLYDDGYLPEVIFLDAGLVTTLNDKNRRNFLELFRAIAEFDGYRAGQLMVERCRTPALVIDAETFALRMQHIVLSVKRTTFSLGRIKISDILSEVLRCVRQHHVKMEGDFVNTVISVLLLEGIGRQLDPGLDLFKSALPILRKLGRQMTAQEGMESMTDLPHSNLGAYLKARPQQIYAVDRSAENLTPLKLWVWLEARQLASAAFVDFDEMIRTDWCVPVCACAFIAVTANLSLTSILGSRQTYRTHDLLNLSTKFHFCCNTRTLCMNSFLFCGDLTASPSSRGLNMLAPHRSLRRRHISTACFA
jgi:aarF domain-containing kinase